MPDKSPNEAVILSAVRTPSGRYQGGLAGFTAPALGAVVIPKYLFIAPAKAVPRLLDKVGWNLADVDLVEINEAFAAQVLADGSAMADFGWDWSKLNVNGGSLLWTSPPAPSPPCGEGGFPKGNINFLSALWRSNVK